MDTKITEQEYQQMTEKASPHSKVFRNCIVAFLIGGAICALGQGITALFLAIGASLIHAKAFTSITLVALSAFLTSMKIYDKVAKHGGAGTLVPITGFANAIVSPAMEFKSEGFIMGIGAKMFSIAGPVLVYGTCTSILYGLIIFILKLY